MIQATNTEHESVGIGCRRPRLLPEQALRLCGLRALINLMKSST